MSLETIYYITQIVAVGLILVSLVAIYWQQRQSNRIARSQNAELLMASYGNALREIMVHEDLAVIMRKVMFDGEHVSPVEATRISVLFNLMLSGHRAAWNAAQDGLYNSDVLKNYDANTTWYLSAPIFLAEWKRIRTLEQFSGSFVDHIDSLIADTTPPDSSLPKEEPDA